MRLIGIITGVLICMVVSMSVDGARFPNAIEKEIVLTGEAAISIAELFGLSSSGQSSISLQLGPNDAWAVYLFKQRTKEFSNENNRAPARYNTVEFSTYPTSFLTISPYWLDLGTQLPEKKVGYYSFGSPFISEKLDLNGSWEQLLRLLMTKSGWDRTANQQFQICFTSLERIELCIFVFSAKDYTNNVKRNGYRIVIEAHINNV